MAAACSKAESGTTHGEIEVRNDLPRKGPSGTYSHACRSRADQSFSRQTPNTCSGKAPTGTGRSDGAPTTKPSSASRSSRVDGPNVGTSLPASRRCPDGRTTGVPETATVPARPW